MGTQSNFSGELRETKDVNEHERALIRASVLSYKALAEIFHIKESQVRYIRSAEGQKADQAKEVWTEKEEALMETLYLSFGWSPNIIAKSFPDKTYAQVYRKMNREFRGK